MSYGLKVYDEAGNSSKITVKIGRILASGSLIMPNSLEADNTYGKDVALGAVYQRDEIGVMVYPTKFAFQARVVSLGDENFANNAFAFCWYADSNKTYYTKAWDTGVMSAWAAGSLAKGSSGEWDGMVSAFPLAGWDYPDSQTEFANVRIWAAMAHGVYDASAVDFKPVYTIGGNGVEEVQYMVFLRGT